MQNYQQGIPVMEVEIKQLQPQGKMIEVLHNANDQEDCIVIECFHCGNFTETHIKYKIGFWTLLTCACLQFICGPLGSFVLCIKDCKDSYHYCSKCGGLVGVAKKKVFD